MVGGCFPVDSGFHNPKEGTQTTHASVAGEVARSVLFDEARGIDVPKRCALFGRSEKEQSHFLRSSSQLEGSLDSSFACRGHPSHTRWIVLLIF